MNNATRSTLTGKAGTFLLCTEHGPEYHKVTQYRPVGAEQ